MAYVQHGRDIQFIRESQVITPGFILTDITFHTLQRE